MKLCKPTWVNHDKKPVFSVDIHPLGNRFATGGQGENSGKVVVWNLSPVLYEEVEMDSHIPKMLCQMDNHLACVNCVRWSNNGLYLASAGDDCLVIIWTLSGVANTTSRNKSETWRCLKILRGHSGDVLDLAWSPRDRYLASCSVDNTIIVWNAEKFPVIVCVLNGHSGLVKGVAWDPVGKYLASQSEDKSLRVWNTEDWASKTVITDPFEKCGGTTHVLRLSWSPDGQYVLSAHAMNGEGPTAKVVERESWKCDKDFVGHEKAVICVRFNSNIFVKKDMKCCCAAVGSRDRTLSIWLTSLKRPLVIIRNLFEDSIVDLSWSSDGLILLASSTDGTVACIQFTNEEMGTPITIEEKNKLYKKKYGFNESGTNISNLLVECPEILIAREKNQVKKEPPKEEVVPKPEPVQQQEHTPSSIPLRQIETRTSDGKRRITPVSIPFTVLDANESLGSQPESCFSMSSQGKSRIRVERRDDIVIHPNVSNSSKTDGGIDGRLRKRTATSLPGPKLEEAKRPCGGGPVPPPASPDAPLLPAPALGTAGPVVRAAGSFRLQVVNKIPNMLYGALSKLELIPNNSVSNVPVWETYLGSAVTCVACDVRWASVACADAGLHAWRLSRPPARALPHLALQSQAAKLTLTGDILSVITTGANIVMWDLAAAACVLEPLCFRSLLTHGVTASSCTLLDDNPVISLSNGKNYIYCKKLFAWILWSSAGDSLRRAGGGALPALARAPLPRTLPRTLSARPHGPPRPLPGARRSWVEAQAAAAAHLHLPRDYRHWTCALFDHLLQHGTEDDLRHILDDMLGPSHCTSAPKKWQDTVLGIKKHDMLEDMLAVMVKHQRWQRLYLEYSEQYNTVTQQKAVVNGH